MGLAYGKPKYTDIIKNKLIKITEDGSFQINMSYFDFATGINMTNKKFNLLFGGAPRIQESKITQREMDLAASIQKLQKKLSLNYVNVFQKKQMKNIFVLLVA